MCRPDKQTQAGHYTLRCGRRRLDGTYQLPLVALSLSFGPGPLSMRGLQTLFHEFGHVLNSLLSRTDFQHYSGTPHLAVSLLSTFPDIQIPCSVMLSAKPML